MSLINRCPDFQILCFVLVSFVVGKRLLTLFWKRFEFLCVSYLRVSLLFFAERCFVASDVVDLEGVVFFGVVHFLCRFPLLFQNVVQEAGFRKKKIAVHQYEESVVVRIKLNLLLMIFWVRIINYNS
jgi:hypothetical protein